MQKHQKIPKVLLTGGHAGTSAVCVVNAIKKSKYPWSLYWIGPAKAYQGENIKSFEGGAMTMLGVKSFSIDSGKAQRIGFGASIKFVSKLLTGFIQALRIVDDIRPNVILSFGGYVAFPVVIVGKLLGSKVIIHEQVVTIGLGNKFTKYFADKIALGWEQSTKYFSKKKSIHVGLPIADEIVKIQPKDVPGKVLTILVMGGSRGSVAINDLLMPIIAEALTNWSIIHVCGRLDYARLKAFRANINASRRKNYQLYSFMTSKQIASAYDRSDIIISRAGAHSVNEIMHVKRPSILIPLPLTNGREQDKNADAAKASGVARVISQEDLTSEKLLAELKDMSLNWRVIRRKMTKGQLVKTDAATKMVDLIKEILS